MNNISRKALFEVWWESTSQTRNNEMCSFVINKLGLQDCTEDVLKSVKHTVGIVFAKINSKWAQCGRHKDRFSNLNSGWLENSVNFEQKVIDAVASFSNNLVTQNFGPPKSKETETQNLKPQGRPSKPFAQLSGRSKRRKTEEIRSSVPAAILYAASTTQLYMEGKRAAADLLKQTANGSPQHAVILCRVITQSEKQKSLKPYSPSEALALFIDSRMSKQTYLQIRQGAKKRNADIYPSHHRLVEAKKQCYPEGIEITEQGAYIPAQNLFNHTCKRICETLQFPVEVNFAEEFYKIELFFKWGCDGSNGQNEYMQLFKPCRTETDSAKVSEKHVFMFSVVPLKLVGYKVSANEKQTLWANPSTSSTKYCRPIKFLYIEETKENTQREISKTQTELDALQPCEITVNGQTIKICYTTVLTMLDTKVISAVTDSSSQSCYICGAKPTQMNNLSRIRKLNINEENLKYGLSTLHAWIKLLECVLHIAFKLEYKKTTIRGATSEEREKIQQRKRSIQDALWQDLGIKVDRVVQGSGTSNTGNVARRFFANPEKAAEATGVDANFIKRLSVILQVVSSGHEIDDEKFDNYAWETAKLYVQLYNWYRMPPSLHKILIHGSQAVKYAILPIGQLSEEAQESRNKEYRRFREHNTRKSSRLDTTRDLMNILLVSSDPVISSLRLSSKKSRKEMSSDAIQLLAISAEVPHKSNEECLVQSFDSTTSLDSSDLESE